MTADLPAVEWRKSTYSDSGGNCIQVAELADGGIAVRDSKCPEASTLLFTRSEMTAWLKAVKVRIFDDPG